MPVNNIPFNTNLIDSIDSYISNFDDQILSDLNLIAIRIREGMQLELNNRYGSPQSKGKGFPIEATGRLGGSINNDANWDIQIDPRGEINIFWADDGGASSNDGTPFSKIYYLDHGASPAGSGESIAEQDPNIRNIHHTKDASPRHSAFYNSQILGGQRRDSPEGMGRAKLRSNQMGAMDAGGTGEFRSNLMEWARSKGIPEGREMFNVIRHIAKFGMTKANPNFIVDDLFDSNYQTAGTRTLQIIQDAIDSVMSDGQQQVSKPIKTSHRNRGYAVVVYRLPRGSVDPTTGRPTGGQFTFKS